MIAFCGNCVKFVIRFSNGFVGKISFPVYECLHLPNPSSKANNCSAKSKSSFLIAKASVFIENTLILFLLNVSIERYIKRL